VPAHSWQPVDLVGLALEPPEPPTLDAIAYPGRRHIWSGEPESLKSWAALVLCAEEMHQGRDVVYVDLEMGRREMLARLRDLGLDDETIGQHFIYLEPSEPLSAANVRADLAALLADRLPTLAVVDAMTGALQLHGLDPNSGRDIETFYRAGVELLRTTAPP
jgi:AAA domain